MVATPGRASPPRLTAAIGWTSDREKPGPGLPRSGGMHGIPPSARAVLRSSALGFYWDGPPGGLVPTGFPFPPRPSLSLRSTCANRSLPDP